MDEAHQMIIEMRTYRTKPGLRSQFLEIFREFPGSVHAQQIATQGV